MKKNVNQRNKCNTRYLIVGVVLAAVMASGAYWVYPQIFQGSQEKAQLIATVPNLGKFVIRDKEDFIQAVLLKGQPWEPQIVPYLEKYLRPGMNVADIGAYNGVHAVRFARMVGSQGRVYAFEPNPPAFEMLEENIKLNRLEGRIIAYPYGISDMQSTAWVKLSDNPNNLGGTHLCSEMDLKTLRLGCDKATEVKVEMIRVDDDIDRWFPKHVHFAKIDVEGHEERVLAGAKKWIDRDRPVLFIEIWDDRKRQDERMETTAQQTISQVEEMGYRIAHRVGGWDYFFVPTES